jgi:hypothetical protein
MRRHLHIDGNGERTVMDLPDQSAEELAAIAAQLAADAGRTAKARDIRDQIVEELALLKAGTTDFGSAARNRCARRALRALRFLLTGEVAE